MKCLGLLLLSLVVRFGTLSAQETAQETPVYAPIPNQVELQGRWKEDQYKRKHLSDFLYEVGLGWIKRLYVTSASWENEQTIFQNGQDFRINGFSELEYECFMLARFIRNRSGRGSKAEVYSYTLVADNSTMTEVNMGELGGPQKTYSYVEEQHW
ncbi:uncharacterized protein LOC131888803 [Tigriopus californicus]|uniref:uncharacterized protein LOC131888803 n=1 Tax=Tigriopus californicus TaxID=6832 RepID=UPI0027DA219D|nr:uncharacterized protein LOC131888803 [Tigriopus californicus]